MSTRESRVVIRVESDAAEVLTRDGRAADETARKTAAAQENYEQFAREATDAARQQARQVEKLAHEFRDLERRLDPTTADTRQLEKAQEVLNQAFRSGVLTTRQYIRLLRQLNQLTNKNRSSTSSFSDSVGKLWTRVLGLVAALEGVRRFAGGVLNTGAERQQLAAVLETFLKSREAAAEALEEIRDLATKTPFQIDQITDAFNRLLASGITPTERELLAFGNIASGTQKSLLQFTEAAIDAQVGEFERLKEFGIKAKVAGDSIALTFDGQTRLIKKDAKSIIEALTLIGETKFAGAMERQMATFTGATSNMADAWSNFQDTLFNSGFGNFTAQLVRDLTSAIKVFDDWIQGMRGLADNATETQKQFYELEQQIIAQYDAVAEARRKIEIIQTQAGPVFQGDPVDIAAFLEAQTVLNDLREKYRQLKKAKEDDTGATDKNTDATGTLTDAQIKLKEALANTIKALREEREILIALIETAGQNENLDDLREKLSILQALEIDPGSAKGQKLARLIELTQQLRKQLDLVQQTQERRGELQMFRQLVAAAAVSAETVDHLHERLLLARDLQLDPDDRKVTELLEIQNAAQLANVELQLLLERMAEAAQQELQTDFAPLADDAVDALPVPPLDDILPTPEQIGELSREQAEEMAQAWEARAEQAAETVADFLTGSLADTVDGDWSNIVDRAWNMFKEAAFDAIAAVLKRWLAQQWTANVTASASGQAGGGILGGLFGGGAGSAGALAGLAPALGIAALYFAGSAMVERNRQRQFSAPLTVGLTGPGQLGGQALGGNAFDELGLDAVQLRQSIADLLQSLIDATGGFAEALPEIAIQVRRDGEQFRVQVGDFFDQTFSTWEEAIQAGVTRALSEADISGIGQNVANVLQRAASIGIDELGQALAAARAVDLGGVSEAAQAAVRDTEAAFAAVRSTAASFRLWGIEGAAAADLLLQSVRRVKDGIEQDLFGLIGAGGDSQRILDAVDAARAYNETVARQAPALREAAAAAEQFSGGGGGGGGGRPTALGKIPAKLQAVGTSLNQVATAASDLSQMLGKAGEEADEAAEAAESTADGFAAAADDLAISQELIDAALEAGNRQLQINLLSSLGKTEQELALLRRLQAEQQLAQARQVYAELLLLGRLTEQHAQIFENMVRRAEGQIASGNFNLGPRSVSRGPDPGVQQRQDRREEIRQMIRDMSAGLDLIGGAAEEIARFEAETADLAEEMRRLSTFTEAEIEHYRELRAARADLIAERASLQILEELAQMAGDEELLLELQQINQELRIEQMRLEAEALFEMGRVSEEFLRRVNELADAVQTVSLEPPPESGKSPVEISLDPEAARRNLGLASQQLADQTIAYRNALNELHVAFRHGHITAEAYQAALSEFASQVELDFGDRLRGFLERYFDDEELEKAPEIQEAMIALEEIRFQLELHHLETELQILRELGAFSDEQLARYEEAIGFARDNIPDFTKVADRLGRATDEFDRATQRFSLAGTFSDGNSFAERQAERETELEQLLQQLAGQAGSSLASEITAILDAAARARELAPFVDGTSVADVNQLEQSALADLLDRTLAPYEDAGRGYADQLAEINALFAELLAQAEHFPGQVERIQEAQQNAVEALMGQVNQGMEALRDQLIGANAPGITAQQRFDRASQRVDELAVLAQSGDLEAQAQLGQALQDLLAAAGDLNDTSSAEYQFIQAQVLAMLGQFLGGVLPGGASDDSGRGPDERPLGRRGRVPSFPDGHELASSDRSPSPLDLPTFAFLAPSTATLESSRAVDELRSIRRLLERIEESSDRANSRTLPAIVDRLKDLDRRVARADQVPSPAGILRSGFRRS